MIDGQPEIGEVRFSLPNKHHFVVDLSPYGLENPNEVFHADDRPYGLIEGTIRRDDAPDPGAGVRPRPGVVRDGAHATAGTEDRTATHPVDEVLKPRTDGRLRPAARDEHVRGRGGGAADRRQRAEPAVLRSVLPAGRDAADLRPRDPAADARRLADRRQTADRAGHLVRRRGVDDRHRQGRGRRHGRPQRDLRRHHRGRCRRVPAQRRVSAGCCTSSRRWSPASVITVIGISLLPGGDPLGRRRRRHAELRLAGQHRAGRASRCSSSC